MSVLESTSMLEKALNNIEPLDQAYIEAARHRLDRQNGGHLCSISRYL